MNKATSPIYSRAMLHTLPISFSSFVNIPFRQLRTLSMRGPAVLVSRSSPEVPEQASRLIVLSPSNRPLSIGKNHATLSGLKISFPESQTRDAFVTAANTAIRNSSTGIDRYIVCQELGRGAAGIVYLVRRRGDGKKFAMKTIAKSDAYMSGSRLQSLISERTALGEAAQRGSPFIVKLVDAFETDRRLCFVTELEEYGDLKGILKRVQKGRLSEKTAKILFAEALLGLEETHRMGFLFRDMKLANLLLNRNGHVKVADFGLAKRMEVEYHGSSVSSVSSNDGSDDEGPFRLVGRTISFVGTRRYMSPEHLEGGSMKERGYSAPADVWALGVTLYILLTGGFPFGRGISSRDTASMFHAIRNEKLSFPVWVGKEARTLLEMMLERDAAKRMDLDEIKGHVWMKGTNWDRVRYDAEKDVAQEEVLKELEEEGILIEEEDMECSTDGCSMGSSMSCESSCSSGSSSISVFDRMELVGFGYYNWSECDH